MTLSSLALLFITYLLELKCGPDFYSLLVFYQLRLIVSEAGEERR